MPTNSSGAPVEYSLGSRIHRTSCKSRDTLTCRDGNQRDIAWQSWSTKENRITGGSSTKLRFRVSDTSFCPYPTQRVMFRPPNHSLNHTFILPHESYNLHQPLVSSQCWWKVQESFCHQLLFCIDHMHGAFDNLSTTCVPPVYPINVCLIHISICCPCSSPSSSQSCQTIVLQDVNLWFKECRVPLLNCNETCIKLICKARHLPWGLILVLEKPAWCNSHFFQNVYQALHPKGWSQSWGGDKSWVSEYIGDLAWSSLELSS